MSTNKEFIDFAAEQIRFAGAISAKKMFGEYMLYCEGKPIFLVCDNTVFVKQLPETKVIFETFGETPEIGIPYNGAKPHFILDIENGDLSVEIARLLSRILPNPKPKKKKNKI
jgi:hypothetical protein